VLSGAPVIGTDLRASAALVIAGLAATGTTTVQGLHHLDRGYDRLDLKLQQLGAKILRVNEASKDVDLLANNPITPASVSI
jgi:UDP-N-acetylglucosamine 1-carboxyvinyltransferase